MKEISSTEARTHFGALLDMAQREPLARLMPLQQRTYRFSPARRKSTSKTSTVTLA